MAKTKKEKKLNPYTEEKNNQFPVKVEEAQIIGETELPESRSITPVKRFSMPLASVEEIKLASKKYQEFLNALLDEKDIQEIKTKDKKTGIITTKLTAKKSGFGKIARFWGISTEVLKSFFEEYECKNDVCVWSFFNGRSVPKIKRGDKYLIAKAWVKAILPSGQFATRGAAVSEAERNFAHIPHDLIATCETRAAKRAIEAVVGMGEIELNESEDGQDTNSGAETPQQGNQSDKTNNFMGTGDPDTWKPIFKVNKFSKFVPTNDKMPISEKAKEWVKTAIKRAGIELDEGDEVLFVLNNRADGLPRTKTIDQLSKGDFYDLSQIIQRKGKEGLIKIIEVVRKFIPTDEPPAEVAKGVDDGGIQE